LSHDSVILFFAIILSDRDVCMYVILCFFLKIFVVNFYYYYYYYYFCICIRFRNVFFLRSMFYWYR